MQFKIKPLQRNINARGLKIKDFGAYRGVGHCTLRIVRISISEIFSYFCVIIDQSRRSGSFFELVQTNTKILINKYICMRICLLSLCIHVVVTLVCILTKLILESLCIKSMYFHPAGNFKTSCAVLLLN